MTAPTRNDGPGLTRREELSVSSAAMSSAPWKAGAAPGGPLGLAPSLSAGAVALFAVAGGGALVRSQSGRAMRWARANPWRFALLPGAAAAIIVFVLSVVIGSSGVFGGAFTAVGHGAVAYGVTGLTGTLAGGRNRRRA